MIFVLKAFHQFFPLGWTSTEDAPPAATEQMRFLGRDTSTPYEAKFDAADAGKTAYYRLRWVNRQGEPGDWGAIASAMVMDWVQLKIKNLLVSVAHLLNPETRFLQESGFLVLVFKKFIC